MNPIDDAKRAIDAVRKMADDLDASFYRASAEVSKLQAIDFGALRGFIREPWCVLPKSKDEWWVVVPKWAGVQAGWLERTTETYNIFSVNRYSLWVGGVPEELRDILKLPAPFNAVVDNGVLKASAGVADRFKHHLKGGNPETGFRIVRGHEFDLLAELIEAGSLPFKPQPIVEADLIEPALTSLMKGLRPYQQEGWDALKANGALTVCWPFGLGKTVLGIYALASLGGRHLVVAPTRTLVEQWQERLRAWTVNAWLHTDVVTYHSWAKINRHQYTLCIFDECHRLPANQFSRLATVSTKYRLGLSATPIREDDRTNYIFALAGRPIGIDWSKYIREGLIKPPSVRVEIVSGWNAKVSRTATELRGVKGRALVFCDSINRGKELAHKLDCPHIHGQTKDRLAALKDTPVVVISRVGDEGLSLPDLRKVIEVDFHGGSRRQEGQRVGRLFHADGKGEHVVFMTEDEYDAYERRFLALEEKGIHVSVVR